MAFIKATRLATIALFGATFFLAGCAPGDKSAERKPTDAKGTSSSSTVQVGTNGKYADVNGLKIIRSS